MGLNFDGHLGEIVVVVDVYVRRMVWNCGYMGRSLNVYELRCGVGLGRCVFFGSIVFHSQRICLYVCRGGGMVIYIYIAAAVEETWSGV